MPTPSSQALVYAYALAGARPGRAIEWPDIKGQDARRAGKTPWCHLDYTHPDTSMWLHAQTELDDIAVTTLLSEETRPRAAVVADGVLLTLRGINMNPDADPEDMVSIRIWADASRIISTRHRRMLSAQDMAQTVADGTGPRTSGEFLALFVERLMARMQDVIGKMEDQVEEIEEQALDTNARALRGAIADLRRQAVALRRYLKPQLEAIQQLSKATVTWITEDDRARIREAANHLTRYIEELESIRDRAAITQEELAGMIAEQLNNRMYVLSIVAALFLPLGFLTGLLGVNVGGIPGSDDASAFALFCGILGVLVAVQVVIFRVKHWF